MTLSPATHSGSTSNYNGGNISFYDVNATGGTYRATVSRNGKSDYCEFQVTFKPTLSAPVYSCPENATVTKGTNFAVTPTGVQNCTPGCKYRVKDYVGRNIVATRIKYQSNENIELINKDTRLHIGDLVYVVIAPKDLDAVKAMLGNVINEISQDHWDNNERNELVSERLVVTNPKLNGRRLGDLKLRQTFNITITRVRRAGIELIAHPSLILQLGDRVTIVGEKSDVDKLHSFIGDSVKKLDEPQLFTTFFGIALGILLGTLPIMIPSMPVPVKLGLAGGPLIVSILLSSFGPRLHLITYSTTSANLLMRQIGICMFMASVGLGAGIGFVDTVLNGGYMWVLYGFLITFLPCVLMGIVARVVFHKSYFTIAGMISGAMTDPPALAYSNSICGNDQASVAYSTVYPLTMFLRVLIAQLLVLCVL